MNIVYCDFRNRNMSFKNCCNCWSSNRHYLDLREKFISRGNCDNQNRRIIRIKEKKESKIRGEKMTEFDELIVKLLRQEKKLISVIAEAEKKKDLFLEAIAKGKIELEKIESILENLR